MLFLFLFFCLKTYPICDVENYENGICPPVVRLHNRAESLVPGCVPLRKASMEGIVYIRMVLWEESTLLILKTDVLTICAFTLLPLTSSVFVSWYTKRLRLSIPYNLLSVKRTHPYQPGASLINLI